MKVVVTGATGFVGSAIAQALVDAGHQVIAAVRNANGRAPTDGVVYRELDFMDPPPQSQIERLFDGARAVVNAVGIIRETRKQRFKPMHAETPIALFAAAQTAGVRRVVQISAAGTHSGSDFDYFKTKARADEYLQRTCSVPALILRPSLVYGARGEASQLFQKLAALPVVPLPAGGNFVFRPLLVEDLAQLVLESVSRPDLPTEVVEVGGPEALSLKEILLAIRASNSRGRSGAAPSIAIPKLLMKPAAWFGDLTGAGPLTSDMLNMLVSSEATSNETMNRLFQFRPRSLLDYLSSAPAQD